MTTTRTTSYCWNCTYVGVTGAFGMVTNDEGQLVCPRCGGVQAKPHLTCPRHGPECIEHPPLDREDRPRFTGYYTGGISVAWSPINCAWLVLWGRGPIETREVLRVITDSEELSYYLGNELQVRRIDG